VTSAARAICYDFEDGGRLGVACSSRKEAAVLGKFTSLVIAFSIFSGVARAEVVVHTNMAGHATCAAYLKARSQRNTLPFELWLSGYLTGLATYDKKINNVSRLQEANGDQGTLLLDGYCKTHPLESYQIAAREMARSVFYRTDR
jgi:hypothetical protein